MTPEQAWIDGRDEKNGLLIEFDSLESLRSFRFRMYKARQKITQDAVRAFEVAVLSYEGKKDVDQIPDLPPLTTGLEGLTTMNRGPKSLWVGREDFGIVNVARKEEHGDGDGDDD